MEAEKPLVLLADDDPRWRELMAETLAGEGWRVITFENGTELVNALMHHRDAAGVILDVMMPDVDGYEIAERILRDRKVPSVPIVFMSAHTPDEAALVRPMALGIVFDVLAKDQGPKAIAGALRVAVNATKAVAESET